MVGNEIKISKKKVKEVAGYKTRFSQNIIILKRIMLLTEEGIT